jgi:hypothetical protein
MLLDTSSGNTAEYLTKQRFRTVQYESLADILRRQTSFVPLRNGGFGQYDALSVLGGGSQHLSMGADGRPMLDLWSGQFHLLQQPLATLERLEFLYGCDAIGLAPMTTLTMLNAQSSVFNTATPFMSMWYHQGAGDLIAASVTFSQNIAPGWNIAANVRRSGARGRYQRTDFGLWNLDLQARWTVDQRQTLLLRYSLSTVSTQVWGGLDRTAVEASIEQLSRVRYDDTLALEDETRRHDATLTYGRVLAADSTSLLTLQGYASAQMLHRLQASALRTTSDDTSGLVHGSGTHAGFVARLDQRIGLLRLRMGSHVEVQTFDSTSRSVRVDDLLPSAFLHAEYRLSSLTLRAAARLTSASDRIRLSAGGGATVDLQNYSMRLDLSMAEHDPTAVQRSSVRITERHTLAVAELAAHSGVLNVRAYYRGIADPIITVPGSTAAEVGFATGGDRRIVGASASGLYKWGSFELCPRLRAEQMTSAEVAETWSFAMLDLDVAYVFRTSSNSVRIGVNGAWLPSSTLPSYEPLVWSFRQGAGQAPSQIDGLSAYITAQIGNASLRASYENILGNRWYTVLSAPELSRVFRLSVDWSFTD